MKKTLVVLLILAVAGGVFAQELKWNGEAQSGVKVKIPDGGKAQIEAFDDDGHGAKASLTTTYDVGEWGLKVGLGVNWTGGAANPDTVVTSGNAYGWINFAENLVSVKAGVIDDAAWAVGGEVDDNVSNGLGIRFEINPMEGVSLGLILDASKFLPKDTLQPDNVSDYFQSTGFGASYTTDMFNVAVGFKLAPDWDKTNLIAKKEYMKLIFGVGLNIIENLDIYIDGRITNLGDFGDNGAFELYEEVGYQISEQLKVGVLLGEFIDGKNHHDGFWKLLVKPWVEFKVNENISVGADVPLTLEDNGDFGFASFGVNAWAQYAVGGAFAKAGYGLSNRMKKYGDSMAHEIYLLFGFSF